MQHHLAQDRANNIASFGSSPNGTKRFGSAFTIIELLVVVVIIGILVAIVSVSYAHVTRSAAISALLSDLDTSSSHLELSYMDNDIYPGTDGAITDGKDLPRSDGTIYQYTKTGDHYCLTATSNKRQGMPYYMVSSEDSTPREGFCPGHKGPPLPENKGVVTTIAGAGNRAVIDGSADSARFFGPYGLAVDDSKTLFVTEWNGAVRRVSQNGDTKTLAGNLGEDGQSPFTPGCTDGVGSNVSFWITAGVAVDRAGMIYVSDGNNRCIRKVTPNGTVTTLAGSGYGGATSGVDGPANLAEFSSPRGLTIDHKTGDLYVAEYFGYKIRKVSPAGYVSTFAGSTEGYADGTGENAKFGSISDVAMDSSGTLYATDFGNGKIRKIMPDGTVTTLALSGTSTSSKYNGIAIDREDNMYVTSSSNRIEKITPSGIVTVLAGSTTGFADGTGTNAKFNQPVGIAVDSDGVVYVADKNNYRIRKIQ